MAVDVSVPLKGGPRKRAHIDAPVDDARDLAGLGRPFYAEPRLPARLLADGTTALTSSSP